MTPTQLISKIINLSCAKHSTPNYIIDKTSAQISIRYDSQGDLMAWVDEAMFNRRNDSYEGARAINYHSKLNINEGFGHTLKDALEDLLNKLPV
jgi:hypothetical protein